jgi:sulfur-oxidizing protein SoxZ
MAFGRITLPQQAKRGEPFEVRVAIRHAMETGYRVDDYGRPIARNTIREIVCRYNGVVVMSARLDSGIAANPFLRFFVTAEDSGEVVVTWVDDDGERGEARAVLDVVA